MKYTNAKKILPIELVEEIQKYIQGEYLYVPIKENQRKHWGENSGYRKELSKRNKRICDKYNNGTSIENLADEYFLSIYAIKKIVY